MSSTLGSRGLARYRALVSLLLGLAAGLGLVFPAQHGCRSAAAAPQSAEASPTAGMAGVHERHDGHGLPTPASQECSCVGDACGPSLGAPLSVPILAAAPVAIVAVAPVASVVEPPATDRTHVLPFANGPPAFFQA